MLASFRNPNGLIPLGNNQWSQSQASGSEVLNAPGGGVSGTVQSGATEDSNIDLTNELVNMIVAQRNYQANAQTIKTQDQVLNTLVNLR
jgi:flagellar hook protein FlgE